MPNKIILFRSPSRSRGAVLAIVLVVLVVMMLGGVSMLRSLDTSALLSGNLAYKRESVNRTSVGLSQAFINMKLPALQSVSDSNVGCSSGTCSNAGTWKKYNYWPRLLEADSNGVPLILKDKTTFDATFTAGVVTDSAAPGSEVRYLIERMCYDYGTPNETMCAVSDHYERGGSYRQEKPGAATLPLYRITIRSDGVRNTQTYAQAIVTTRVK